MLTLKDVLAFSVFFLLLWLTCCDKYYATLSHQWVDARYLASTHVPDPRQDDLPIGEMMII